MQAASAIRVVIASQGAADLVSHPLSRGTGGQFVAPRKARYCWRFANPGSSAASLAMELEHP